MTTDPTLLPAWVYDLVTAVQDHEDAHRGVKDGGTCLAPALEKVPILVRQGARLIAGYKAQEAASEPRVMRESSTGTSVPA